MFIMAIVHIVSSYAQSVLPISGEVLDGKNREPLIGVTVVEKGTKNGVITDIDGKFSMRVPVGTILKTLIWDIGPVRLSYVIINH